MSKTVNYTAADFKALEEELDYLKNVKREENKKEISRARSFGDLSENSEYDEAKAEQAKIAARIAELENMINNAHVIDEAETDASVISLGSVTKVKNLTTGMEKEYTIVGSFTADPFAGKISDLSPIGRALIGAKTGDVVDVLLPNGKDAKLEVISVARASV